MNVGRHLSGLVLLAGLTVSYLSVASDQTPAVPTDTPDEVSYWLKKMDQALHQINYSGTYIYMRGRQLDSVRVAHQVEDGVEYEKLTSLNGEMREIVRRGDELICHHDGIEVRNKNHPVPMGRFTHGFTESLNENLSLYKVFLHGKGRVAGRVAIQMSITPRNNDRYGYMLWLDEATGLLLQSNLVNRGRVLELFQYSDIQIGESISPGLLASSLPEGSSSHSLWDPEPDLASVPESTANAGSADISLASGQRLRDPWVPDGFRRVRSRVPNSLQFSDGIATLTIFIEKVDQNGLGNVQTSVGGTVLVSRKIKGTTQQVTLVGEIPLATAQKIAESIKPVIY